MQTVSDTVKQWFCLLMIWLHFKYDFSIKMIPVTILKQFW